MGTIPFIEDGSILDKIEDLFTHHHEKERISAIQNFDTPWYQSANKSTDSNGNLSVPLGDIIPVGKCVRIYRLIIWADGYTPGAAYVNAASWVGIYNGPGNNPGCLEDFSPEADGSQVFPSRASYGKDSAPLFKGGEQCYIGIFSGPPSCNITITARGRLEAL